MQKIKIKSTVHPDHRFISYSAWMKYIRNRNNQKLTKTIKNYDKNRNTNQN
jgi:hypothetical protein